MANLEIQEREKTLEMVYLLVLINNTFVFSLRSYQFQ